MTTLLELPYDVLSVICDNLDIKSVCSLSRVNSKMRKFYNSPAVNCMPFKLYIYNGRLQIPRTIKMDIIKDINTYCITKEEFLKLLYIFNMLTKRIILVSQSLSYVSSIISNHKLYGLHICRHSSYPSSLMGMDRIPSMPVLIIVVENVRSEISALCNILRNGRFDHIGLYININYNYDFENSNMIYKALPSGVKSLTTNILMVDPDTFPVLDKLEKLILIHSMVECLPTLPSLIKLDIYGNRNFKSVSNLPSLQYLECGVTGVSDIVSNTITELNCYNTNIQRIECTNLRYLHISNINPDAVIIVPNLTHLRSNYIFTSTFRNYVFPSVVKLYLQFKSVEEATVVDSDIINWIKIVPKLRYYTAYVRKLPYIVTHCVRLDNRVINIKWIPSKRSRN